MSDPQTLTTTQVAKLCGVANRTVCGWADRGLLKHHRMPTARRDRRFRRDDVNEFMKRHGIPDLGREAGFRLPVLVCMDPCHMLDAISTAFTESDGFDVRIASNAFEAGREAMSLPPSSVIIIGLNIGRIDAGIVLRGAKSSVPGVIAIALETSVHAEGMGFDCLVPSGTSLDRLPEVVTNLSRGKISERNIRKGSRE